MERNHAGPNRKRIIRSVIFDRAGADFCGDFRERKPQDVCGFQFLLVGLARVVPAAGENLFRKRAEGSKFFFGGIHGRSFAERHNGTIVHGMVEYGAGENEAIEKCDCDANTGAFARAPEHAAGCRAVKIDEFTDASVHRGNDIGLGVRSEPNVADKSFIENFVDGIAIVDTAMRFAHDTRALRSRKRFRHEEHPVKTRRIVDSRRRRGMNGEQSLRCYHRAISRTARTVRN